MYTAINLRFLYENENAVKFTTVDGKKEVFIHKNCILNYSNTTLHRCGVYEFDILTCVLKRKGLLN